jgi:TonB-dependent receptor
MNVPSPETGVRQIKFDAIPADIVEAVEINKTLQANMDGDGLGGSVNLVTKTAQDRPTISLSGMGGFTPIDTGRGLTEWTGTLGERFGKEKRWGALFGASYDWNGRGIDDIEPVADINTLPNGSMQRSFDQIAVRQYVYYRSRWAIAGSTDYKLGAGSDIFVRWLYSDFKNYGDRTEYVLNNNDPTVNLLNPTSGSPSFDTQDRRPDIAIGTLTFGGIHSFSTIWYRWEGSVSRSRDTNVAPGQASFSSTLSSSACQYNPAATTNLYLPQWTPSCYAEAYNQDNYALSNIQISYGKSAQLNLQGTMSVGKQYHLGSHAATFEIGGKFRNAHKFDDTYSVQLTPTGTIPLSQFPSRLTNNNYYGGSYPAGPDPHYQDVIAYANANPGQFTSQSTFGADPANYDLVEKVSAGYLMNTIDVTSRLRFIAGLRIEGTQLTTFSFDTTSNVLADRATGSYVSVLPSAALRYGLTSRDDIRLSYARGLARPDPQDIAQAVTFTTTGSPGSLKNTATLGNPDLKAETGDNFDLLYEHYFDTFGMFSAGYFYKRLTDPIATEGFIKTDFQPSPIAPSGTYSVTQPINAGSAWISDSKLLTCNTFRSFRACCEVSARRQTTATRYRRPAAYPGERITPDSCATPRTHGISAPLTI